MPWVDVCDVDALTPERGAAALVDGRQLALFRLRCGTVHALGNLDPFSGVNVLSRGIVGDKDGTAMVTSPMYKQPFALETGRCLVDDAVAVPVYAVRVRDGRVEVDLP